MLAMHPKGSLTVAPRSGSSRWPARLAPIAGFLLLGAGVIILPFAAITLLFAMSPANTADSPGLLTGGLWSLAIGLVAAFAGASLLRGRKPTDEA